MLCASNEDCMGILSWLEDKIDSRTPKVNVIGYTKKKFSNEEFQLLISALVSEPFFKMRKATYLECVLNVSGKILGDLSQAKVLFGKNPEPKMYKNMKSRFRIKLKEDGRLEIESFEHLMALKDEEFGAFQSVLSQRLEII